jgi:hypothetical protein
MPITRIIANVCLAAAIIQLPSAWADDGAVPAKVSFYFAAHEDDWQLFMTPAAFEDVTNDNTKTVFVHVTAGDAGLGTGRGGRKHPFYLARENGAEAAIRFMAHKDYESPRQKLIARFTFGGHKILRVAYRNTVTYFLRLPDGSPAGTGYERTGFQSLERLAAGESDTIAAIDGSAVYHGWSDLTGTIRAIIDFERGRAPTVVLNVAELDPAINPRDHSDHLLTARAALDGAAALSCARRVYYVNYASSRLPENLSAQQRDMASSVFAVTLAGVLALDHSVAWHRYDSSFVGRSYFRTEEGTGPCETRDRVLTTALRTPLAGRALTHETRR